uniref:NUDIX hydrolase n=1 Tax=Trepomonas sp. PC1 TaxID=1076344 RepID=A0A146KLL7_9EUKA|eukprot:JAP96425.1 NUDIX hydrolase [Trepomonas sp. PC1]
MFIQIHQKKVSLQFADDLPIEQLKPLIEQFKPLSEWAKNMDPKLDVKNILIQSIDLFGKRIGFLKIKAEILNIEDNKTIPGIIFFRGDAVAILPIIKTPSQQWIMLTEQFRAPLGRKLLEIPAGMCDGDGNFSGVAIKELEEETGLHLNSKQLFDLGSFIPSAGGCDEKIHLFGLEIEKTDQEVELMQKQIYGEGDHEVIKLKFVKEEDARQMEDSKLLIALARFNRK